MNARILLIDRIFLFLVLATIASVVFTACQTTGAQVAASVAAAATSAVGIIDAVTPLLTPEQAAKLHSIATHVDGGVQATQSAVSAIADVITHLRDATQQGMQTLSASVANSATKGELYGYTGTAAGGSLAVSRALSVLKHGARAVVTAKAA